MRAWVWLLGPEEFAAVDWEDYENYGAPILKKVAELVGFEWPEGDGIDRMASGLPCQDYCQDGCGS